MQMTRGASVVNAVLGPRSAIQNVERGKSAPSGDAEAFRHAIRHALTTSVARGEDVDRGQLATLNVGMARFASVVNAVHGLQSARTDARRGRGAP